MSSHEDSNSTDDDFFVNHNPCYMKLSAYIEDMHKQVRTSAYLEVNTSMKDEMVLGGKTFKVTRLIEERFGISGMTLSRWEKNGVISKPISIGKRNYYNEQDIEESLLKGVTD